MSLAILTSIIQRAEGADQKLTNALAQDEVNGKRILIIRKDAIGGLCMDTFSTMFREFMEFRGGKMMQVVGDSTPSFCSSLINQMIQEIECVREIENAPLILYGLTGRCDRDGRTDINHIVNNWLDGDPVHRSRFACGVITDIGTYEVVRNHCYNFSGHCDNFIVVNGGATFGDDIRLTDSITDILLLVEGGIQSFVQAVNVLMNPLSIIHVYTGYRSDCSPPRFSAARFLRYLAEQPHPNDADLLDKFCSDLTPLTEHQKSVLKMAVSQLLTNDPTSRLNRIVFHYR